MNWIAFLFALELGVLPNGYIGNYINPPLMPGFELNGQGYVDLEGGVELFNFLYIGGGVKTYVDKYNTGKDFMPANIEYDFQVAATFGVLSVGYRHYCFHPTIPWVYKRKFTPAWEAWYEEIYIRVEVRK